MAPSLADTFIVNTPVWVWDGQWLPAVVVGPGLTREFLVVRFEHGVSGPLPSANMRSRQPALHGADMPPINAPLTAELAGSQGGFPSTSYRMVNDDAGAGQSSGALLDSLEVKASAATLAPAALAQRAHQWAEELGADCRRSLWLIVESRKHLATFSPHWAQSRRGYGPPSQQYLEDRRPVFGRPQASIWKTAGNYLEDRRHGSRRA
jgi:hypothetical protein